MVSLTTAGCDAPSDESLDGIEFREGETTTFTTPKRTDARDDSPGGGLWINNGLSAPSIGGIDPAYPLSTSQGMSETEGVLVDSESRIAAQYLVECALPSGSVIEKVVDGETVELEGQIGLAPEWEDGDCDEDCQQWVTACMLARTNVNAETIQLSLRADHPVIGLARVKHYNVYEGSFYGNIFADPDAQFVCAGSQQGAALDHLVGRTCSSDPAACGFELYQDCNQATRCTQQTNGGDALVSECHADGDASPYHTINVYLRASDVSN